MAITVNSGSNPPATWGTSDPQTTNDPATTGQKDTGQTPAVQSSDNKELDLQIDLKDLGTPAVVSEEWRVKSEEWSDVWSVKSEASNEQPVGVDLSKIKAPEAEEKKIDLGTSESPKSDITVEAKNQNTDVEGLKPDIDKKNVTEKMKEKTEVIEEDIPKEDIPKEEIKEDMKKESVEEKKEKVEEPEQSSEIGNNHQESSPKKEKKLELELPSDRNKKKDEEWLEKEDKEIGQSFKVKNQKSDTIEVIEKWKNEEIKEWEKPSDIQNQVSKIENIISEKNTAEPKDAEQMNEWKKIEEKLSAEEQLSFSLPTSTTPTQQAPEQSEVESQKPSGLSDQKVSSEISPNLPESETKKTFSLDQVSPNIQGSNIDAKSGLDLTAISLNKMKEKNPTIQIQATTTATKNETTAAPASASWWFDLDTMIDEVEQVPATSVSDDAQQTQIITASTAPISPTTSPPVSNTVPQTPAIQPTPTTVPTVPGTMPVQIPQSNKVTSTKTVVQHKHSSKKKVITFVILIILVVFGGWYIIKTMYPIEYERFVGKIGREKTTTQEGGDLILNELPVVPDSDIPPLLPQEEIPDDTSLPIEEPEPVPVTVNTTGDKETHAVAGDEIEMEDEFDPFADLDGVLEEDSEKQVLREKLEDYLAHGEEFLDLAKKAEERTLYRCAQILSKKPQDDLEILDSGEDYDQIKMDQHLQIFEDCLTDLKWQVDESVLEMDDSPLPVSVSDLTGSVGTGE